tara:strand:+ start:208 stop:1518 length:1311 start_codon:yes stop_codon:yes gene_type:complete
MSGEYSFDAGVQDDILCLISQDPDVAQASVHWVKPGYFQGSDRRQVSRLLLDFVGKYGRPPTKSQALTEATLKRLDPDAQRKLELCYSTVLDTASKEYTIDTISDFAQAQGWRMAMLEAVPLLQKGKFDEVAKLMDKTSKIKQVIDSSVYWFFETMEARSGARDDEEHVESNVIPTGIMELDELIRNGGPEGGEIGLWIAPTNGGKSLALNHCARRSVWENRNTAVFTFEMSEEKVADRLDSSFTGIEIKRLREEQDSFLKSMGKLANRFKDRLMIKRFPTKGATIADVRACLESVERSKGWRPDMIVLDYAAIVKPAQKRDQKHLELQEIAEDFRGLCVDYNAVGWSAMQASKEGSKASVVRGHHGAGSWDSLGIWDYIITICQTAEERAEEILRLFFEKNRDGDAKILLGPFLTNWAKMAFVRPTVKHPRTSKW